MKSFFIFWGVAASLLFHDIALAKKRILVTSFHAFAGRDRNNSSLVSEELKRLFEDHPDLAQNYTLDFVVLPVQARVAAQKARDYIDKMNPPPDLVLSLGESAKLASEHKSVEVNFMAHNVKSIKISSDDYRDVNWDTSANGKIYPYWEDSVKFNIPLAQMYCSLHDDDKRWVSLEDRIGAYVCNDTAFDLALYLKDQAEKTQIGKNLSYPYMQSKNKETESLKEEKTKAVEELEAEIKAAVDFELSIRRIIDNSSYLRNELPRLWDLLESEKSVRYETRPSRYNSSYDSNSRSSAPSSVGQPHYDVATKSWGYRKVSSSNEGYGRRSDDFQSNDNYRRRDDYSRDERRYSNDNYRNSDDREEEQPRSILLPGELLDYKKALEATARARAQLNSTIQDYDNRIRSVASSYDAVASAIENITLDSTLARNKPFYGFVHIPILAKGDKTNPLEIAKIIAIMMKSSFENNFPNATVDFNKGKISCGLDSRFVQSEPYQKVAKELQSLLSQKDSLSYRLRSRHQGTGAKDDKRPTYVDDESLEKIVKRTSKEDPETSRYLSLLQQIKDKREELTLVAKNAPQAHSNRNSYFQGHEKFQTQGTYDKQQISQNLLKFVFKTDQKDLLVPQEFSFGVKTDSNKNIVFLIRDQLGREQVMDLSQFETDSLIVGEYSARSKVSLKLDNSKNYSKYELRRLRGEGGGYHEINSRIEYWMLMTQTYPQLMNRTEYRKQENVDSKGKSYTTEVPYTVSYWTTQQRSDSLLLKFSDGKWSFYQNGVPFNVMQFTMDQNEEENSFIASVQLFDIPVPKPPPPVITTQSITTENPSITPR